MFAVGDRGLGSVAVQDCRDKVPIRMGTFNKGLGSLGGFVLGTHEVVHHLRSSAKSYRFTASPSPPQTVAAMKSLEIMKEEPERFAVLQSRVRMLRNGLRSMGIDAENNEVPVIPVYFESHEATAKACELALERDVVLYRAGYPATPRNVSMIRMAVTSEHTEADIELLLGVLGYAKKFGLEPKGSVVW
jgi:7-keto-8-aminopelargonate synthetase-like enzyme